MNLNLGCGPFHPEGWVSVDVEPGMKPDVVADILSLPFGDESADKVYLGHVLEHLPFEMVEAALAEATRVLRPGGKLGIVGPDIQLAWEGYKRGLFTRDTVEGVINGSGCGGHETDIHLWTCEARIIKSLITKAFPDARVTNLARLLADGWPVASLVGWQFAIVAEKDNR